MKKYIGLIFILVLPYIFAIGMGGVLFFDGKIMETVFGSFPNFLLFVAGMFLLALLATVVTASLAVIRKWDAAEVAKVNMMVKVLQIPSYILIFIEGVYFSISMMLLTPVAGILFVIFDCAVIVMTGITGAAAVYRVQREEKIDKGMAVMLGIGQFIFCIDVICAIAVYIMAGKKK